jgi:hypothetical protein
MKTIRLTRTHGIVVAAIAAGIALPTPAEAKPGHRRADNYVVAHSEFGNGTVVGRIRPTSKGWQVQLPGGAWVYCARSCKHTLRLKTVDFWQSEEGAGERNALTGEPGLFHRWLHWERRY